MFCEDIQGLHYADMLMDEALPGLERLSSRNLSVQFTSGTTSRPQGGCSGLMRMVCGQGKVSAIHMRLRRDDITLVYIAVVSYQCARLFHACYALVPVAR